MTRRRCWPGSGTTLPTTWRRGAATKTRSRLRHADAAEVGGDRLEALVGGLRAADTDEPMHLTLIGHSYGSTTVGQAAHDHHLPRRRSSSWWAVRGLDPESIEATDLGFREHTSGWAANSRDPVARLGDIGWVHPGRLGLGLGANPASEEFAAQRFRAETVSVGGPFDRDVGSDRGTHDVLRPQHRVPLEPRSHRHRPW